MKLTSATRHATSSGTSARSRRRDEGEAVPVRDEGETRRDDEDRRQTQKADVAMQPAVVEPVEAQGRNAIGPPAVVDRDLQPVRTPFQGRRHLDVEGRRAAAVAAEEGAVD